MSSYAEMAHRRKRARPLYLELKALGLEARLEDDPETAPGYRIVVAGMCSLSEAHADRIKRRVLDNEAGLVGVLLGKWDPDLEAVRREGSGA